MSVTDGIVSAVPTEEYVRWDPGGAVRRWGHQNDVRTVRSSDQRWQRFIHVLQQSIPGSRLLPEILGLHFRREFTKIIKSFIDPIIGSVKWFQIIAIHITCLLQLWWYDSILFKLSTKMLLFFQWRKCNKLFLLLFFY